MVESSAASHARTRGRLWPLVALLASLATLFPLLYEAGPLHRPFHRIDHITFNHLATAKNLSPEHGWLGLYSRGVDAEGDVVYRAYNRFPPLGAGLVKLAVSTRPGDLAGQLQAARMLMLACFAAAAVLAYFSLARLVGRRWLVLAATLAAFGSYAALRACDAVATEGSMDLFAVMLAFHGIACYCGPRGTGLAPDAAPRFGQLLAKVCTALLLGWHVYALLAPFLGLGLAAALAGRNRAECRRLLLLGALAFLFGLAVLLQNFLREYFALDGERAFRNLPSVKAIPRRSVLGSLDGHWRALAEDQLHRIGLALAPYAASRFDIGWPGWKLLGGAGLATVAGAAAALAARGGGGAALALASLALVGCCWAVGMPNTLIAYGLPSESHPDGSFFSWDIFEAMFHVGAPLALFALLIALPPSAGRPRFRARRRAATAALAALACTAFVASAFHVGRLHRDPGAATTLRMVLADSDRIMRVARGKKILVAPGAMRFQAGRGRAAVLRFLFADSVLIRRWSPGRFADFVAAARIPNARTLTPDNRLLFLYDMAEVRRRCAAPRLCRFPCREDVVCPFS